MSGTVFQQGDQQQQGDHYQRVIVQWDLLPGMTRPPPIVLDWKPLFFFLVADVAWSTNPFTDTFKNDGDVCAPLSSNTRCNRRCDSCLMSMSSLLLSTVPLAVVAEVALLLLLLPVAVVAVVAVAAVAFAMEVWWDPPLLELLVPWSKKVMLCVFVQVL